MKLCLINNLYEPYNRGGAGEVVKNIIAGLSVAGHDVFLITNGRNQKLEIIKQESGTDYKIYYIKPRNIFSYIDINNKPTILRLIWWFFNIFNWNGRSQIKRILQVEKPDAVLMHNLVGISFLVPSLIKKMGLRHVHTLHDIQLAYPSGKLIYGEEKNFINIFFLRVGYEKLTRKLFGSPDVIVSPSKWLLNFYTERGFFRKSRKEVVGNPTYPLLPEEGWSYEHRTGVVGEKNTPSGEINNHPAPLLKKEGSRVNFLFVGTVEKYKGTIFLIETLKNISGNFVLKIVGEGRDLEKSKELVVGDSRFEFLGHKNKIELAEIYQNSDYLILPTLTYENLPTVILEAFSFGVPTIASKIGGITELVEENKTGWFFEPGNREELKQKIEQALLIKEEIDRMRGECLEKAKEFKMDNYLEKIDKLLKYY